MRPAVISESPTSPPSEQFSGIWNDACNRYTDITGVDLLTSPDAIRATSAEDLLASLDAQQEQFAKYQEKRASLRKLLDPALRGIELLANVANVSVGSAIPPSSLVFAAISLLIKAARNVASAYESIIKLLDVLKAFVSRVKIHVVHTLAPELREVIVKKLSVLLVILGLSAKMIKAGRALRLVRNVLSIGEDSQLQVAIEELEALTHQEAALERTLSLSVAYDTRDGLAALQMNVSAGRSDMLQMMAGQTKKEDGEDMETMLKLLRERLDPELSVQTDYDNVLNEVLPGTGDWILSEALFEDWINSRKWLLWISGGPGSGKSHLSARIIKRLTEQFPQGIQGAHRTSVAYFFCREANKRTQSFSVILRTAAYQIARNSIVYLKYLHNALKEEGDFVGGHARLWQILFVEFFKNKDLKDRAYIIIDGLDEALKGGYDGVETFLEDIRIFSSRADASPRLQFLLVGRPEMDDMIYDTLEQRVSMIELSTKYEADVEKYIRHQLSRSRNLRKISLTFRDEIISKLSGKTFLWVKLVLKEIASKNREGQMREAVDHFPKDLGSTIEHVLERFAQSSEDDVADLNELLAWVTCARRPLTLGELEVVMAANSPTLEPVLELERLLRKHYSTFFTLVRDDGLRTADLQERRRNAHGFVDSDTLKELEDDLDDDYEDEIDVFDSPKTTTVTISHLSFTEYFRNQTTEATKVGVFIPRAELQLAMQCLSLICNERYADKWSTTSATGYACQNFLDHLVHADRAGASITEKQAVVRYLYQAFTDESTIIRWLGRISCNYAVRTLLETDDTVKVLRDWIADEDAMTPGVVADWCREVLNDEEMLLRPSAMLFAKKWLQDSVWTAFECFRLIYAFIRRFEQYPGQERFSGDAASKLATDSEPPITLDDALLAARWAGFPEDHLWLGRVGRLLRDTNNYKGALECYQKGLALNDSHPTVLAGLGRTYGLLENFEEAIKWSTKAVEVETVDFWLVDRALNLANIASWKSTLVKQRKAAKEDALAAWNTAFEQNSTSSEFVDQYLPQLLEWEEYLTFIAVLKRLDQVEWKPATNVTHSFLIEYVHRQAHDSDLHDGLALAARKTDHIPWLIDLYKSAIGAAEKLTIPRSGLIGGLRCGLARVYLSTDDLDTATKTFELALEDNTMATTSSQFFTLRSESICRLGELYYKRACMAETCSEDPSPFIAKLEGIAKLKVATIPATGDPEDEVLEPVYELVIHLTRETSLLLGFWHRMHGRDSEAQVYFRDLISLALDLLTDDVEQNDAQAYGRLGMALLMAGDERGAKAAYQLIGKFDPQEAAASPEEDTGEVDVTGSEDQNDRANGDDEGNNDDAESNCGSAAQLSEWLTSHVGCDGPCGRTLRFPFDIYICSAGCLEKTFCGSCLRKLKSGQIEEKVCSPNHKWLHVTKKGLPELEKGKVRFVATEDQGEVIMELQDWYTELKREWQI